MIDLGIETDEACTIFGEPVVSGLSLLNEGGDFRGFSRCVTRLPGAPIVIDRHCPYRMCVDLLEYEDDPVGPLLGVYQLRASVIVLARNAMGDLKAGELLATADVTFG